MQHPWKTSLGFSPWFVARRRKCLEMQGIATEGTENVLAVRRGDRGSVTQQIQDAVSSWTTSDDLCGRNPPAPKGLRAACNATAWNPRTGSQAGAGPPDLHYPRFLEALSWLKGI